jgi:predicted enzyme related to lactoylglutathione lyase
MKKSIIITAALVIAFGFGYAFNSIITKMAAAENAKKATGIGGIFFKCKEPKKMREWYKQHLGINAGPYGATFAWYQGADSTKKGYTQWTPFKETTKYFEPSTKDFMINYRVENLEALVKEFNRDGVTVTDTIATYPYGKFVHIMDVEGNKVELWQANDEEYGKMGSEVTK